MLNVFKGGKEHQHAAERLYAAVVTRSREPVFFARLEVPDTLDGRFDLLTLHAWLVLRRYQPNAPLAQAFVDRVFVGFDEALREMGAGDMGLGRRMKTFADAFYGRLKAYEAAEDAATMNEALVRNLYRGNATPAAAVIANYVMRAEEHLNAIGEGDVDFGPLPGEDQP
jgi:cytochrome b pre-mRNA-processing protein 3